MVKVFSCAVFFFIEKKKKVFKKGFRRRFVFVFVLFSAQWKTIQEWSIKKMPEKGWKKQLKLSWGKTWHIQYLYGRRQKNLVTKKIRMRCEGRVRWGQVIEVTLFFCTRIGKCLKHLRQVLLERHTHSFFFFYPFL